MLRFSATFEFYSEVSPTAAGFGSAATPPPARAPSPDLQIRESIAKDAATNSVHPDGCKDRQSCDSRDSPTTGDRVDTDQTCRVNVMLADGMAPCAIAAARPDPAPADAGSSCPLKKGLEGTWEGLDAVLRELRRARSIVHCRLCKERAVRRGCLMHRPVYGYSRTRRGVHVVVPEQARVVRGIFIMAQIGLSPVAIAAILTSMGYPSPPGERSRALGGPLGQDRWTARHVRTILRRPLYIGLNVFGRLRKRVGAFHPRLVVGNVPHLRIVGANEVPYATAAILVALSIGRASA